MTINDTLAMSHPIDHVIQTTGSASNTFVELNSTSDVDAWNDVINYSLIEWGKNPAALDDEGFEPPSRMVVSLACKMAAKMRDRGLPPPTYAVPDGDGGVNFENRRGNSLELIAIDREGGAELITFCDSHMISRQSISI